MIFYVRLAVELGSIHEQKHLLSPQAPKMSIITPPITAKVYPIGFVIIDEICSAVSGLLNPS